MNCMIHHKRKKEIKQIFQLIKDLHNTCSQRLQPSPCFSAKSWEVISIKLTRISFSVLSTYFSFSQMGHNLIYHAKLP